MRKRKREELILRAHRERWLRDALEELRPHFADRGYSVPDDIRISVREEQEMKNCFGIFHPGYKMRPGTAVNDPKWMRGANYPKETPRGWSVMRPAEIWLSEELTQSLWSIGILAHEIVHACMPASENHGSLFQECALAIGLLEDGKEIEDADTCEPLNAACFAGHLPLQNEEFRSLAGDIFMRIGEYPSKTQMRKGLLSS